MTIVADDPAAVDTADEWGCATDRTPTPPADGPPWGTGTYGALAATMVILSLLAVASMGQAVTSCSSTVRGAPNDGTAAAVWQNWAWLRTGGSPFGSVQHLTGGALGDALWRPVMTTYSAWSLPMWALARLTDPVCAYNLVFVLGFVSSGIGMWFLAHRLTASRLAAGFAAVAFAFSGFTLMKTEVGHPGGVVLVLFPLLVLAVLRVWERATVGRIVAAGVCWGLMPYVDGYNLAFAPVLIVGLVGGMALEVTARGRGAAWTVLLAKLWALVRVGLVAAVVMVPFGVALLTNSASPDLQRARTEWEATRFSARLFEYVVPPMTSPWMPRGYADWRSRVMHGSNAGEATLYLGLVVLALAVSTMVVTLRRRSTIGSVTLPCSPLPRCTVVAGLVGMVVLAVVVSLGPVVDVVGISIVLPAKLVRVVLPEIRVFSRLFVVVATAMVALAGMGLARLLGRIGRRSTRVSLAVGLTALCFLESATAMPLRPRVWDYASTPEVYRWARDEAGDGLIALHPLRTTFGGSDLLFLNYQPVLDRPVLNSIVDTPAPDDASDIVRGIQALSDPQAVPALRALGVDLLLAVDGGPAPSEAELTTMGLETVRAFADGGAAYRVLPGRAAPAIVALGSGWSDLEEATAAWTGVHRVMERGQLTAVRGASDASEVEISFVVSTADPYRLRVLDGSDVLIERRIGASVDEVRFRAPVGRPLELVLEPVSCALVMLRGARVGRIDVQP